MQESAKNAVSLGRISAGTRGVGRVRIGATAPAQRMTAPRLLRLGLSRGAGQEPVTCSLFTPASSQIANGLTRTTSITPCALRLALIAVVMSSQKICGMVRHE